jgi:hypothetical protein
MCSKVEVGAPEQEERDEKLSRHINYKRLTSFAPFLSPLAVLFQPLLCVFVAFAAAQRSRTMEKHRVVPLKLLIIFETVEFITTASTHKKRGGVCRS